MVKRPRYSWWLTDPSILHKILINLVPKAVTFTAARDGLLIEVADSVEALDEDYLATIFERFR